MIEVKHIDLRASMLLHSGRMHRSVLAEAKYFVFGNLISVYLYKKYIYFVANKAQYDGLDLQNGDRIATIDM